MKILKEKVIEDEKNSGIGSLFDDEKTSHQHINLLKMKYMKMRADHEKEMQELKKRKLETVGEKLMLDSQVKALESQTKDQSKLKTEWIGKMKHTTFETDKKLKEVQKAKHLIE